MDLKDNVLIKMRHAALEQKNLIDHLQGITPALKRFLICLVEHCKEHGHDYDDGDDQDMSAIGSIIGRTTLQEALKANKIGSSNASISRNLGQLVDGEIATVKHEYRQDGGRLAYYEIKDFSPLVSLPPLQVNTKKTDKTVVRRRTKEMLRMHKNVLRADSGQQLLESAEHLKLHLHEQIFNGVLDSAMRLSYKDKRVKKLECIYFYAGLPLYITTTCSSEDGSEIMASPDQRAMRSISSLCRQSIRRYILKIEERYGKEVVKGWAESEYIKHIPNLFTIDIHDLCAMMKISAKGEGPNTAAAMLRRLNDTKFEVDTKDNAKFREMFSMTGKGDLLEFRYMNGLEVTRESDIIKDAFGVREELVPRFYTFHLESRIFKSLVLNALGLLSTIFISHEEMSWERSGTAQRFYNWARSFIGGREKGNLKDTKYDLYDMQERLSPGTRMDNFKRYFMDMMEKFNIGEPLSKDNPEITALVYGYYIHLDNSDAKSGMVITVERDRHDPIVGDESRHQQHLRRQAAEALASDLNNQYDEPLMPDDSLERPTNLDWEFYTDVAEEHE